VCTLRILNKRVLCVHLRDISLRGWSLVTQDILHVVCCSSGLVAHYMFTQTVEDKIVPFHAMKAYRRSGGIVPLLHNLGTRLEVSWLTLKRALLY